MASLREITSSPSPAGNKASVCSDKAGIELLSVLSKLLLPRFSPWPSGQRRLRSPLSLTTWSQPSTYGLPSVASRCPRFELFFFLFFYFFYFCVSDLLCTAWLQQKVQPFVCICPKLHCVSCTEPGKKKKADFCCHLVHHAQVCRRPVSSETSEPRVELAALSDRQWAPLSEEMSSCPLHTRPSSLTAMKSASSG